MKKNVVILGSTGSIGKNLIRILKKDKKNFKIELLSEETTTSSKIFDFFAVWIVYHIRYLLFILLRFLFFNPLEPPLIQIVHNIFIKNVIYNFIKFSNIYDLLN